MATLDAQAPDGKTLSIDVPEGIDPSQYPKIVEEAVAHYTSLPGMGESALRGAVNNLPLGGQIGALGTSAIKDEDYSKGMKEWNEKIAESKATHPIAYGAGAVGGTLAPLAIPGVGEAMAAAPATTGAALGAADAVGNTDIAQNPGEAAKQAVEGGITGGALGGLTNKIMPQAESLTNYAERQAIPAVGINKGVLRGTEEETQNLGKFIQESGLVGTNKANILEKALEQQKTIGSKIGEIGDQAKELGLTVKPEEYQNSIQNLMSKSQEYAGSANRAAKALARDYKGGAQDIMIKAPEGDWDSLQKLKQMYGGLAFDATGETKNEAAKDVYFAIKDMQTSIVRDAQMSATLAPEYKEALKQYSQIGDVVDGLKGMVAQERAGGQPHGGGAHGIARIIKSLPGQGNPAVNLGTAGLTSALIHPAAGMAVALPTLTNPAVRSMTATGIAKALPTVEGAIKMGVIGGVSSMFNDLTANPAAYGKYAAPLLQAAQSGGSQGVAATHYILSNTDPAYADMMRKKQENSGE